MTPKRALPWLTITYIRHHRSTATLAQNPLVVSAQIVVMASIAGREEGFAKGTMNVNNSNITPGASNAMGGNTNNAPNSPLPNNAAVLAPDLVNRVQNDSTPSPLLGYDRLHAWLFAELLSSFLSFLLFSPNETRSKWRDRFQNRGAAAARALEGTREIEISGPIVDEDNFERTRRRLVQVSENVTHVLVLRSFGMILGGGGRRKRRIA